MSTGEIPLLATLANFNIIMDGILLYFSGRELDALGGISKEFYIIVCRTKKNRFSMMQRIKRFTSDPYGFVRVLKQNDAFVSGRFVLESVIGESKCNNADVYCNCFENHPFFKGSKKEIQKMLTRLFFCSIDHYMTTKEISVGMNDFIFGLPDIYSDCPAVQYLQNDSYRIEKVVYGVKSINFELVEELKSSYDPALRYFDLFGREKLKFSAPHVLFVTTKLLNPANGRTIDVIHPLSVLDGTIKKYLADISNVNVSRSNRLLNIWPVDYEDLSFIGSFNARLTTDHFTAESLGSNGMKFITLMYSVSRDEQYCDLIQKLLSEFTVFQGEQDVEGDDAVLMEKISWKNCKLF